MRAGSLGASPVFYDASRTVPLGGRSLGATTIVLSALVHLTFSKSIRIVKTRG